MCVRDDPIENNHSVKWAQGDDCWSDVLGEEGQVQITWGRSTNVHLVPGGRLGCGHRGTMAGGRIDIHSGGLSGTSPAVSIFDR